MHREISDPCERILKKRDAAVGKVSPESKTKKKHRSNPKDSRRCRQRRAGAATARPRRRGSPPSRRAWPSRERTNGAAVPRMEMTGGLGACKKRGGKALRNVLYRDRKIERRFSPARASSEENGVERLCSPINLLSLNSLSLSPLSSPLRFQCCPTRAACCRRWRGTPPRRSPPPPRRRRRTLRTRRQRRRRGHAFLEPPNSPPLLLF